MKKGLIIINTGNGKGKTTAAFGMVLRAIGHEMKTEVIQFIKQRPTGEITALEKFAPHLVRIRQFGNGFTWESTSPERDQACASNGWDAAKELINSGTCELLILDEIFYPIADQLIDISDVVETLKAKPASLHVVLTGRNAPESLREIADCVSVISEEKHHFNNNIGIQKGIEL